MPNFIQRLEEIKNLPKSEKGELRKEEREEERELAPQAMPRVFCLLFLLFFEELELLRLLFDLRLEFAEPEREESRLIFIIIMEKRSPMKSAKEVRLCCAVSSLFKWSGKTESLIFIHLRVMWAGYLQPTSGKWGLFWTLDHGLRVGSRLRIGLNKRHDPDILFLLKYSLMAKENK